ncbi:MarR family transcriptional regulator [Actinotalea ferrariae CF5-4]|uniref:MarR family transcriptional regulator n=1 Tax=Actinotalea ferrariae CF5-4 TaxID=948458 RepID=A0A021VPZ1_9CELL|nr:MarR family winged helix-turn-helix transcriptional regulator [Actinotalea ferrariae]EYR63183.1 MarR family transcriptional regulator [Actinotalea ferrariae CF5-4]
MERTGHWPTGRLLSAVARRIEREWNAHLDTWDLNHASLPVLFHLARGPHSQRDLARANGVTEQTMSRILARMERSGYIAREQHPTDRRRHDVVLTAAGRAVMLEAGDPRPAEEMSVRGLEPHHVEQLREILGLMLAAHPHEEGWDDPTPHGPDADGHAFRPPAADDADGGHAAPDDDTPRVHADVP